MNYVKDSLGHDRTYDMECSKLIRALDCTQEYTFEEEMKQTIKWYRNNQDKDLEELVMVNTISSL